MYQTAHILVHEEFDRFGKLKRGDTIPPDSTVAKNLTPLFHKPIEQADSALTYFWTDDGSSNRKMIRILHLAQRFG